MLVNSTLILTVATWGGHPLQRLLLLLAVQSFFHTSCEMDPLAPEIDWNPSLDQESKRKQTKRPVASTSSEQQPSIEGTTQHQQQHQLPPRPQHSDVDTLHHSHDHQHQQHAPQQQHQHHQQYMAAPQFRANGYPPIPHPSHHTAPLHPPPPSFPGIVAPPHFPPPQTHLHPMQQIQMQQHLFPPHPMRPPPPPPPFPPPQYPNSLPDAQSVVDNAWTENKGPQGLKYYYNTVTQQSTWEKPESMVELEKHRKRNHDIVMDQGTFGSESDQKVPAPFTGELTTPQPHEESHSDNSEKVIALLSVSIINR